MSRETAPLSPDNYPLASAQMPPLRWSALIYGVYLVALCLALASTRPQLAVAAACLVLAFACLRLPRWRRVAVFGFVAASFLAWFGMAAVVQPLMYVPPVALNLGMAGLFAATMRRGREPLITTFARLERGTLDLVLARYTRILTVVWVAFFVLAAVVSAVLSVIAAPVMWTWFVTLGNQLAVLVLFLGEFVFRRLRFPQYRHASPIALAGIVVAHWRDLLKS